MAVTISHPKAKDVGLCFISGLGSSLTAAAILQELPQPEDRSVKLRQVDEGLWAACLFQGNASADKVAAKEQDLRRQLGSDGVSPPAASDEWVLAQYNVSAGQPKRHHAALQ